MARRRKSQMAPPIEADTTGRAAAVRAMADTARDDMTRRYEAWKEFYNYRQGIQWPVGQRDRAVLNFTYTNYYHSKALLTEVIPEPSWVERSSRMKGKAMVMTGWWDEIRDASRYRWVMAECVGNAYTYGTGFERLRWDSTIMPRFGGNLRVESVSPWNVLVEPNAVNLNGAIWVIIKSPITRRRLEAYYGKMSEGAWAECRTETVSNDRPQRDPLQIDTANQTWQYEAFIMDGRIDSAELTDPIEEMPYGPVPRYLHVVGNCLLHDGRSRYGDTMPLVRVVLDPVEEQIWGRSRIAQLIGPQNSANARNHAANEAMRQTAFRSLRISPGSQAAGQKHTTKSGQVFYADPNEVEWMVGPGAHPMEQQMIGAAISLMDRLSMTQAATQGVRPTGVTSGVAISALQSAAMAGIRLQMRMIGDAVRDSARKLPMLLRHFYHMERPVSVEGAELMLNGDVLEGDWGVKVDTKALLPSDEMVGMEMLLRITKELGMPPDMIIDKAPPHLISELEKGQLKQRMQLMYQAAAQGEGQPQGPPQGGAEQGQARRPQPAMAAAG